MKAHLTNFKNGLSRKFLLVTTCIIVMGISLLQSPVASAQTPNLFNYQAVARDAAGNIIASHLVTIKISILDGGSTGTASYVETHSVTTNQFGLFTLQVGGGIAVSGSLAAVNWASGSEWMKVEMDATGGSNYADMGSTQLVSVPYSLISDKAVNMSVNDLTDVNGSTAQVGQVLKWNGTDWVPANDNGGGGGGTTYIAGTGISISASNVITNTGITNASPAGGDLTGTYPNPTVYGLQGTPISTTAPNAGQVLKFDGVHWSPGTDNASVGTTYTGGTGISISGTNVISSNPLAGDVIGSPNATTVAKIQNVTVDPTSPTSGQVLKYNGTAWAPGADNGGAGSIYTAGTGISISNNVIATSAMGGDVTGTIDNNVVTKIQTYNVSSNAPTTGQVLKWNGTTWAPGQDNTSGNLGTSLWNQSGNNIYNFNGGNVGIGNSNPAALLDVGGTGSLNTVVGNFVNANASNTSNVLDISNNGTGYNLYSYKSGQQEAVYLVKDNTGSGTANLYATNNGTGNSIDAFATGTGYAGGFHGGAQSLGGVYGTVAGSGYAGYFDGAISGNGIYAGVTGSGYAASINGRTQIKFTCTTPSVPELNLYDLTAGNYARINFQNASGNTYWSAGGMTNSTANTSKFDFSYSPTGSIATLTGDGNMGIGINAPLFRLHAYGDVDYTGSLAKFENNNTGNANSILTISTMGNGEMITASKATIGYGINIQKTGTLSSTAAIYGATAGTSGEGIRGSSFGNGGYGVYGNAAGNGTNAYYGVYGYASGSAGSDYSVYGLQGQGSNDYAGYFSGNLGYTGLLLGTSDEKLKTNVKTFTGALNSIMLLSPKVYEYRQDGDYKKMRLPEGEQIGLIAQDIEKVLPDLVKQTSFTCQEKSTDPNVKDEAVKTTQIDYKGVNYIGLIPVLVGAIQEQQKEIEELKLQLARLNKQ